MNNKEIADALKAIGFKDDLNRFRLRTLKMTYRSWSFYTVSQGILAASENETFCLLLEKKWSPFVKNSIKLHIDNLSPSVTQLSLF